MSKGVFAVIIGPAGVGKTTVMTEAMKLLPGAAHVISTTSRPMRPKEVDGRDYHFLTREFFEDRIESGDFIEWADYAGHYYGTSSSALQQRLDSYPLVVKIVEVQGARIIKRKMPESRTIFLLPGYFGDLERRLMARPNAIEADVQRRLAAARHEIAVCREFDHRVVNYDGRMEDCVADVVRLLAPFV